MQLFIKLSYYTSEEQLEQVFSQFGEVTRCKIVTDHETGESRGFGFVTMTHAREALNAVQQLDGSMLDGRKLSVSEARQQR